MDNALKFIVDVVNSEEIQKLTKFINLQKEAVSALNNQLQKGIINDLQFAAATQKIGMDAAHAAVQIKQLEASSAGAGRGLSQLAYAVDDIQYGFNAIVNNIPQIAMGLGMGMGVAGAAGIAAVAINQLVKHWGELTSALQAAWEGGSAERLQVLADRAEAAAAAFEKMKEAGTPNEQKGAKEFGEAVGEAGAEHIRKQLTDTLFATGGAAPKRAIEEISSPAEKWAREKLSGHKIPGSAKEQDQLQYDETAKMAVELLGAATSTKDPAGARAARDRIANLMKANPKAFDEEFRTKFEASDPERMRAEEQKRLDLAGARLGRKEEEKAEEKDKKLVDALNKAGQENQRIGEERLQQQRVRDLEDKRDKIQTERQDAAKAAQEAAKEINKTQILQGPKAVIDMYQKAAGDTPMTNLQKKANDLLKSLEDQLKDVNKELKKQQRVRPAE
jgi:hypothetical protein